MPNEMISSPVLLNHAERQAAALLRLDASRTQLRGVLIREKPAAGWASAFSGGLSGMADWVGTQVQRYPAISAFGAVLLGAMLVRARPWRWALSTGVWGLLVPRVLPTLMTTLTAARLGVWTDLIAAWLKDEPLKDAPRPSADQSSSTSTPPPG